MKIKVASEEEAIRVGAEAIHILNNLRKAMRIWDSRGGYESRQLIKKWEGRSDLFLESLTFQKEASANSEHVKIIINNI